MPVGNGTTGCHSIYGYDHPDYWSASLQSDPDSFLNSDFCVIKNKDFFVRCLIEIPILGSEEHFRWGVWTTLSKANFDTMTNLWNDPKLLDEPPYFGWLSNSIDTYPETLNLKLTAHSRTIEQRPYLLLEPTDHPLAIEQRSGIPLHRVREIAERSLHR